MTSHVKRLAEWREIPIGGAIIQPGNSAERFTGDWRVFKPVINQDKCVRCYLCWVYCPEPAVKIVDKPYKASSGREWKVTFEIDYNYCKGCGICVEECPVKAIDFIEEVK
jgi:pyruvate ferredoxin oxidoreductase delta subunit